MNETAPRVIKIPAKPESVRQAELQRQLRVAAYCRVSTKEEDQANSYEVQKEYYTDKIMSNPVWTMAGVFADKGITGTSVKKREDFMRMIRHCRQRKIDVVLTKSVSRFARNTVDCLYYTRALKELGIAVIFEKENINSLEEDSELRITLSGAFAQSESESISANVTWGKRRAMESGKATIQYKYLYGYRRGADDKPEIIPEEAEVVRWIYERYLAGASTRMLRDELHEQGVTYSEKSPQWTLPHIKSILRNEKYCGDVLMQKTFQQDVINRKVIKNTGQLPMYLIENHHEGIVSREKYNAVQAEIARRKAAKSPSKRASTGLAAYTSRYALSDRLVCGECGTLYRRCTWTRPDGKRVVWRCVSRLDYGKKYCHSSPTLDEAPLQQAIIAALNTVLPDLDGRIRQITEALGAEVQFFENEWPACKRPVVTDDPEAVYKLRYPKPWESPLWKQLRRTIDYFQRETRGDIPIAATDPQGPFTNASPVWDTSEFFAACYTNPNEVHHLMRLLTDQFIEYYDAQLKVIEHPAFPGHSFPLGEEGRGISISDDNCVMISPALFEEFNLPYLSEISEHFGGLYYHSCGRYPHMIDTLLKIPKLRAINWHTGPLEMGAEELRKVEGRCAVWTGPSLPEAGWGGEMPPIEQVFEDYYVRENLACGGRGVILSGYGGYTGSIGVSAAEQDRRLKKIRSIIRRYGG